MEKGEIGDNSVFPKDAGIYSSHESQRQYVIKKEKENTLCRKLFGSSVLR